MNAYEEIYSVSENSLKPKECSFSPYDNNEGSVLAVGGKDFAIVASESRLSSGFSIYTRNQSKLFPLTDKCVLACSGCWCDVLTLSRITQTRIKIYAHEHNKVMSTPAIGQMISTLLYFKRFFPYYVHTIVAGLDENGEGNIFNYDSVGHKGNELYMCTGSSAPLIQPLLDNQVALKNMINVPKSEITLDKALNLVKDVFTSAAERDIYTGDNIVIKIITKDGIKDEICPLRKD